MSHTITTRPVATPAFPRRVLLVIAAALTAAAAFAAGVWIADGGDTQPAAPTVVDRPNVSTAADAAPASTLVTRDPGTVSPATTAVSLDDWDWEPCRPNVPC